MGVVSGIVLAFEFGTNWSELSRLSGPIQWPLLSYETFTAFMLAASFFGVLLLGKNKVRPGFYLFSTTMVALGTTLSAFWIMVNNSWMQYPVGYTIQNSAYVPDAGRRSSSVRSYGCGFVHHVRDHLSAAEQTPKSSAVRANTYELVEFLHDVLKVDAFPWTEFPHKVGLHNSCGTLRSLRAAKMSEIDKPFFSKPFALLKKINERTRRCRCSYASVVGRRESCFARRARQTVTDDRLISDRKRTAVNRA
jgi:Cytochrome bd terminal oxidase subunit I